MSSGYTAVVATVFGPFNYGSVMRFSPLECLRSGVTLVIVNTMLTAMSDDLRFDSIILGIGVPVSTQLIGVNIMAEYSTTIFKDAGLKDAVIGSIIYAFGDVLASGISLALFDRYGRVSMAFVSFSGMALSYLALAFSQFASPVISGYLSVVFVFTFVLSFGSRCGALNICYAPEVVPPQIASTVIGMGQSLSIFIAFIEVLLFPTVCDTIGPFASFQILFVFCIVSLIFLKIFMVETKDRQLDEIVQSLYAHGG